jgi:RNA polymerase sigma factor (sigma-70 family)
MNVFKIASFFVATPSLVFSNFSLLPQTWRFEMNTKSLKVVTLNQTVNAQNSNSYCCFDQKLQDAIHCKARKLVGHYGITESDIADIEQELAIEVVNSQEKYDELKSKIETFVNQVCENKITDIIRERMAKSRNVMETDSLFSEIEVEEGKMFLIDCIPARSSGYPGMRLDIEAFMDSLRGHEKELLGLLQQMSQSDIAKVQGTSLTTINYRVSQLRKKIRRQDFFKFL